MYNRKRGNGEKTGMTHEDCNVVEPIIKTLQLETVEKYCIIYSPFTLLNSTQPPAAIILFVSSKTKGREDQNLQLETVLKL